MTEQRVDVRGEIVQPLSDLLDDRAELGVDDANHQPEVERKS